MFIPTDSDLPSWFKKRSYLHFDSKVSLDKTKEIVLNPKAVSSHAFYPFIKYSVISEATIYFSIGVSILLEIINGV